MKKKKMCKGLSFTVFQIIILSFTSICAVVRSDEGAREMVSCVQRSTLNKQAITALAPLPDGGLVCAVGKGLWVLPSLDAKKLHLIKKLPHTIFSLATTREGNIITGDGGCFIEVTTPEGAAMVTLKHEKGFRFMHDVTCLDDNQIISMADIYEDSERDYCYKNLYWWDLRHPERNTYHTQIGSNTSSKEFSNRLIKIDKDIVAVAGTEYQYGKRFINFYTKCMAIRQHICEQAETGFLGCTPFAHDRDSTLQTWDHQELATWDIVSNELIKKEPLNYYLINKLRAPNGLEVQIYLDNDADIITGNEKAQSKVQLFDPTTESTQRYTLSTGCVTASLLLAQSGAVVTGHSNGKLSILKTSALLAS